MRTLMPLSVVLALMLVPLACNQGPKPPQPTVVENPSPAPPALQPIDAAPPGPGPTVAPTPKPVDVTPPLTPAGSYTIQKGDTLWSIATRELGDGKRWKEIVAANPGLNEKSLPVGKAIKLPAK